MTRRIQMNKKSDNTEQLECISPCTAKNKKTNIKSILKILMIVSLFAAFITGFLNRDDTVMTRLKSHFPETTVFEKINDKPLLLKARTGETESFVAVVKRQGWGGPMTFTTETDRSGVIKRVFHIDHRETPSFFIKLEKNDYFKQYPGKKASDPIMPGTDVDTISRATISSKAIAKCIRIGSHEISNKFLGMNIQDESSTWNFGLNEIILLLIYVVILIGVFKKITKLRYVTMAAGLVFLGFYLNNPISISGLSSIPMGYFPPLKEKLFWWLLTGVTLLFTIFYGRNIYCYWLCPFGAIQEFTSKISGINLKINKNILKYAKDIAYVLTWFSLMVIFLTSNPGQGTYEPFATLFALEGIGVQWFILPLVILSSFFIKRFWCRFFCPAGIVLTLAAKTKNKSKKLRKRFSHEN